MKTLRLSADQLAMIERRLKGARTVRLMPREAWPTRRDRQIAGEAVAQPQRHPGRPATAKKAHFDRWPQELAVQCRFLGIPQPCVNWPFLKEQGRRFRLDCAWPDVKLVVEVDGGVHRIRDKFSRDLEKHRLLFENGWRLLRVSPAEVNSGAALGYVEKALISYRGT